jgi:hypothetical protein
MPATIYPPEDTTAAAFERGVHEGTPGWGDRETFYAPAPLRLSEIRDAVDNWRFAQSDHGHTSFWGVAHIRAMRAYWLGRMRAAREEN